MKKITISAFFIVSLIFLSFTFIPNVSSQPENVEILNYSWYILEQGAVVIVGEVQNIGPNNLEYIRLQAVVYTKDGEPQAVGYRAAYSEQIQPQQKAPFQIYIFSETSNTGDLSWVSIGIDHVSFLVVEADVTEDYQYQDLEITASTNNIASDGSFMVSGSLRNTGDRIAGRPWVVATFYNATGHVIATGFSKYLDVLSPGETTTFTVAPNDAPIELSSQITDYALIIQTEAPIFPDGPFEPPTSSPPTSEPPTSPPPESEAPTNPSNGNPADLDLTPLIIAVPIVLAFMFIIAILFRRKKS